MEQNLRFFKRQECGIHFQDTDHELGGFKNDKGCHYKELYGIRQMFCFHQARYKEFYRISTNCN